MKTEIFAEKTVTQLFFGVVIITLVAGVIDQWILFALPLLVLLAGTLFIEEPTIRMVLLLCTGEALVFGTALATWWAGGLIQALVLLMVIRPDYKSIAAAVCIVILTPLAFSSVRAWPTLLLLLLVGGAGTAILLVYEHSILRTLSGEEE